MTDLKSLLSLLKLKCSGSTFIVAAKSDPDPGFSLIWLLDPDPDPIQVNAGSGSSLRRVAGTLQKIVIEAAANTGNTAYSSILTVPLNISTNPP